MTAVKNIGGRDEEGTMSEDRAVINLTDTRSRDDRRLRDHLLAADHVDDPHPFAELDWYPL